MPVIAELLDHGGRQTAAADKPGGEQANGPVAEPEPEIRVISAEPEPSPPLVAEEAISTGSRFRDLLLA
ncbi:hypothetical protein [Paracoccus aminovorans]|uniref:hypothetical protein n=1 Tax=Paracoccus aminovorans TaxID=34004 RepID=UPI002B25BB36|nr:hypothetical protein [Paracoccus aminovorans]